MVNLPYYLRKYLKINNNNKKENCLNCIKKTKKQKNLYFYFIENL